MLEPDGTWDQRKSMMLEQQLGAMDTVLDDPGRAVATAKKAAEPPKPRRRRPSRRRRRPAAPGKPEPKGPPLAAKEIDGKVVLVFPPSASISTSPPRSASATGTTVVRGSDNLPGTMRDKIQRDGAGWIAPLEFLSEVFVEGKPLTKAQFEKDARTVDGGARARRPLPALRRRRPARDRGQGPLRHLAHRPRRARRAAGEVMRLAALLVVLAAASPALADEEPAGSIVFARGGSLYKVDTRGRGETEVADLPAKSTVRALRTDAGGKVLLVDCRRHSGRGCRSTAATTTLADLPCAEGPAQLAEDGACVLCKARRVAGRRSST